jgi:hypothetical protein
MSIRCLFAAFPGVKGPKREAYQSPSSTVDFKNEWSYTTIPYTIPCRAQGQFYLPDPVKTTLEYFSA